MKKYFLLFLLSFLYCDFSFAAGNLYDEMHTYYSNRNRQDAFTIPGCQNSGGMLSLPICPGNNIQMPQQQYAPQPQQQQRPRQYSEKEKKQFRKQNIANMRESHPYLPLDTKARMLLLRKIWLSLDTKEKRIDYAYQYREQSIKNNPPDPALLPLQFMSEGEKRKLHYETVDDLVTSFDVIDTPEVNARLKELQPQEYMALEQILAAKAQKKKKK